MRVARVGLLTQAAHTGTWYRAVRQHHFTTALSFGHSVTTPTRFNPGSTGRAGFGVLYLAENQQVTLFEVMALVGSPLAGQPVVANPNAGPWTVAPVTVRLSRVIDLCDPAQLQLIDTTVQELTGDWRGYRLRAVGGHPHTAPTQQLGAALYARVRPEAVLTYSAKDSTARNLVVFPTRLRKNSLVELIDPHTGKGQRITSGGVITNIP